MTTDTDRALVALRIDVDFVVGLERAVPAMLDQLARHDMRATFFVVAGSNHPRQSLRRVAKRGYLLRLRRLGIGGIVRRLGSSISRAGGFLDSPGARHALRRIVDEGHEVGVHGHDHAWWADHVWEHDEGRLLEEIERGYAALSAGTGVDGLAWASPAWRTSDAVMKHLHGRGVPYLSECWGSAPFRTLDRNGRPIPVVHLPITLPSLESLVLVERLQEDRALRAVLDARRPGGVDVVCMHDYFEGLLRPQLFQRFVEGCRARGIATTTLRQAAATLDSAALESRGLTRGPVAGFVGEASWRRD